MQDEHTSEQLLALHRQIDRIRAEDELRLFRILRVAAQGDKGAVEETIEELTRRASARTSQQEEPLVTLATNADLAMFLAQSSMKAVR